MLGHGEQLFARIALKNGLLTQAQIDECLHLQHEERRVQGKARVIGEIFVSRGYLSRGQVVAILKTQRFAEVRNLDKLFGHLAVANGFLQEEELKRALEVQETIYRQDRKLARLGELLVEQGALTSQQRDALLRCQLRITRELQGKPAWRKLLPWGLVLGVIPGVGAVWQLRFNQERQLFEKGCARLESAELEKARSSFEELYLRNPRFSGLQIKLSEVKVLQAKREIAEGRRRLATLCWGEGRLNFLRAREHAPWYHEAWRYERATRLAISRRRYELLADRVAEIPWAEVVGELDRVNQLRPGYVSIARERERAASLRRLAAEAARGKGQWARALALAAEAYALSSVPGTRREISHLAARLKRKIREEALAQRRLTPQAIFDTYEEAVVVVRTSAVAGAGFFIAADKILTNCHVLGSLEGLTVTAVVPTVRGKILSQLAGVEIFCVAPDLDYAVLYVPHLDFAVNFLPLKRRNTVTGERTVAIGNPAGQGKQLLTRTISEGIVSGLKRNISGVDYLQTTAAVNPGNSGGPLIGENGGLIGMITRKMAMAENIGFALPVNLLEASFREKCQKGIRLGDGEALQEQARQLVRNKFLGPALGIMDAYSPFVWRQLGNWLNRVEYSWMDPDRRAEILGYLEQAYGKDAPRYFLQRLEEARSFSRDDLRTFQRLFLEEAIAQVQAKWSLENPVLDFKVDNKGLFAHVTCQFQARSKEGGEVTLVDLQCWQNAGPRWYLYSSHLAEKDRIEEGKDDLLPLPPGPLLSDFFSEECREEEVPGE